MVARVKERDAEGANGLAPEIRAQAARQRTAFQQPLTFEAAALTPIVSDMDGLVIPSAGFEHGILVTSGGRAAVRSADGSRLDRRLTPAEKKSFQKAIEGYREAHPVSKHSWVSGAPTRAQAVDANLTQMLKDLKKG